MNTAFENIPLKQEVVFAEAPDTGPHWKAACLAENILSEKLAGLPEGTAILGENEIWYLSSENGYRVLTHAEYSNGELFSPQSRFDFDLMWGDVAQDDLEEYLQRIQRATEEFKQVHVTA